MLIVTNCWVSAKGAWLVEADVSFAASLLSDRVPEFPAGAEGDAFFSASAGSAESLTPLGRASVLSADAEDDAGFAAAADSIPSAGFWLHPVRVRAPRATTVSQRLAVRRREMFIVNCS
ncbi:hypothetical protein [Streptomyces dysideae]|uniref:hypothetical protein n=1 Tax=Streptomyces dysideae TaxID=909626 RepID=UPI001F48A8FC|nr:hypothetical protein [Streptomyces dysideae]